MFFMRKAVPGHGNRLLAHKNPFFVWGDIPGSGGGPAMTIWRGSVVHRGIGRMEIRLDGARQSCYDID